MVSEALGLVPALVYIEMSFFLYMMVWLLGWEHLSATDLSASRCNVRPSIANC